MQKTNSLNTKKGGSAQCDLEEDNTENLQQPSSVTALKPTPVLITAAENASSCCDDAEDNEEQLRAELEEAQQKLQMCGGGGRGVGMMVNATPIQEADQTLPQAQQLTNLERSIFWKLCSS